MILFGVGRIPIHGIVGPILAVDLLLVALHASGLVLLAQGWISHHPESLDLTRDTSLGERLNHLKWATITALLVALWVRTRMAIALGFAITFALIGADDILRLHDAKGAAVARLLGIGDMSGLRARDFGELLVWAVLGALASSALAVGWLRSGAAGRRVGVRLLAFLAALVLFAVVVDMLHVLVLDVPVANALLGLLEDGGEMIVGTGCLGFCAALLWPPAGG